MKFRKRCYIGFEICWFGDVFIVLRKTTVGHDVSYSFWKISSANQKSPWKNIRKGGNYMFSGWKRSACSNPVTEMAGISLWLSLCLSRRVLTQVCNLSRIPRLYRFKERSPCLAYIWQISPQLQHVCIHHSSSHQTREFPSMKHHCYWS